MNTNTKTKDRIKKYSAMAGAFLATGAVNAQINYVDVNPDQVVDGNNSPFMLDLDGDVVDDMWFVAGFVSGTYYGGLVNYSGNVAIASADNGLIGSSGSLGPVASNLGSGSIIASSGTFVAGSTSQQGVALGADLSLTGMISTNIQAGAFLGATDGFIGVSFDISGATHYGWVRLDVAADASSLTIKDYAYNTVPDSPINAGQTVGLEDVSMAQKVHFKPMLNEVIVNVTPDLIGADLSIVDLSGKKMTENTISDVNTTVSYDNIDSGIYLVVVTSDNGSVTKKVYIR